MRILTREKMSRFSSTCTVKPLSAASTAARSPTGPAPLMTTRTGAADSLGVGRSLQLSARPWIRDLFLWGTLEPTTAASVESKATRPLASSGTPHAARSAL